jgi:putative MATE family efflux protein
MQALTRERRRTILALALPTIGGMVSQNVLNLVDMAFVGSLGAAALAAVGIGSFLNFMAFAAVAGLASAVQATAARRYGEGKLDETALPLNGGLLLALLIGIPISLLLFFAAPTVVAMLNDDPAVIRNAVPFLQVRLIGMTAIGMNFAFRGYWTAVKNTALYLQTLLVMHSVNILLSYTFIFGHFGAPALGTAGAALANTCSVLLGTLIYVGHGLRHARGAGFLQLAPTAAQLRALLRLGVPSSIQQLFFAAGFTVLFWIIGQIGTRELAVANVLINITLVAILPGMGLGLAAATMVGQALGRSDAGDADRWAWDVVQVGMMIFVALGLPMLLVPKLLLGIFLHDPALLALGSLPLRLMGMGILLDGIGLILMQALLGAGASAVVMLVSVGLQWLLFLPLAWLVGPYLGFGLLAIWLVFVGYRSLQTISFIGIWRQRRWAGIRV